MWGESAKIRRVLSGPISSSARHDRAGDLRPYGRIAEPRWGSELVHTFEPQRLMFQILCANIALNSCANVIARQVACGATSGEFCVPILDPRQSNYFGGVSLETDKAPTTGTEAMTLFTVDSLRLPACYVIKLDVEGMEIQVLQGAIDTLSRYRPILHVENDWQDKSAALIGLLLQAGYRLYWHFPPSMSRRTWLTTGRTFSRTLCRSTCSACRGRATLLSTDSAR
jgi:FkbM family methyltransferase